MSNEIFMKANELMHGDYVRRKKNKEIVRVFEIDGERDVINNEADGYDSERHIRIDEIEPIPLTPEILGKNGFKIDEKETSCRQYIYACDLQEIPQTVLRMSFYGEGVSAKTLFKCWTKSKSCYGENSLHICNLQYFHELQHALRLCGIDKELTI